MPCCWRTAASRPLRRPRYAVSPQSSSLTSHQFTTIGGPFRAPHPSPPSSSALLRY
uniref:Uncharacterized protein n=1 Tax=Setaria italica TaxID=4555 RepID=K3XUJ9_SETIT